MYYQYLAVIKGKEIMKDTKQARGAITAKGILGGSLHS